MKAVRNPNYRPGATGDYRASRAAKTLAALLAGHAESELIEFDYLRQRLNANASDAELEALCVLAGLSVVTS